MNNWEEFNKKYFGRVKTIISFIFNIASLALAIIAIIKNQPELSWQLLLAIVIFNSLFLIAISIYESILYNKGKKIINDSVDEYSNKNNENLKNLELLKENINLYFNTKKELFYFYNYIVSTLNKFSTQLLLIK